MSEPAAIQEMLSRIIEVDGEPLVLDIDLAERLEYGRPRDIRQLIEKNIDKLERIGQLRCRTAINSKPGPNATEYLLTDKASNSYSWTAINV